MELESKVTQDRKRIGASNCCMRMSVEVSVGEKLGD